MGEGILVLVVSVFLVFGFLIAYYLFSWKQNRTQKCLSPYSGMPLRRATDIHWTAKEKVLQYLFKYHDFANRIFDFENAAYCRETGRIFPDSINWLGTIALDWTFIKKRYPGNFISWGSLSDDQQVAIRDKHGGIDEYQTHYSSRRPSPKHVEPEYALIKPGPLYVDLDTGILMGWKCVPETDLEVLIVQRPKEQYLPGIHKKY